jgi:hypothetical protein
MFIFYDQVGNTGSVAYTVENIDTQPPQITLHGSGTLVLAVYDTYDEL